jgi:hypothetical protein
MEYTSTRGVARCVGIQARSRLRYADNGGSVAERVYETHPYSAIFLRLISGVLL